MPGASNSSTPAEKPSGVLPEFNEDNTITKLWEGPVEHAFFHPLIIAPEKAFDGSYRERGFDDWMVTQDEMKKIFAHLYKRDFVLVKPSEVFKKINGRWQRNPNLRMPKGKKPIIISIDDLSYNEVYQGHGFSDKLVLDSAGKVTAEYTEEGVKKQARDHEIATYINQFVEDHPDFSWKGARGMLALTGYEGILGYRTQEDAPNRSAQIEAVKPVIQALRNDGWEFSSHSFSHDSINHLSMKKTLQRFVHVARRSGIPFGTDALLHPALRQHAGRRRFEEKDGPSQ